MWISEPAASGISPTDRGFTLGDGVFDTLVAFDAVPFAADRHLERLRAQAGTIGIEVDPARIREGWRAVLADRPAAHVILRTTVTRGVGGRALWPAAGDAPTIVVTAVPWSSNVLCRRLRLVTSTVPRNSNSPVSRLKALGYLDNVLAAREAAERGGDDALFLNLAGRIACTTIANLFVVRSGELVTPPPSEGVQPGIMRALVIEAAGAVGLRMAERPVEPVDFKRADAVFATNSVRFLCPVEAVDGSALPHTRDEVREMLMACVADLCLAECGVDPRRPVVAAQ